MNRDDFLDLALRVTEGSATPDARARFEEALVRHPGWREDWLALRRELETTRTAMTDAADLTGPAETMTPAQLARVMGELTPPVRQSAKWRWVAGGLAVAAGLVAAFWLPTVRAPDRGRPDPGAAPLAFVVPDGGPITITAAGHDRETDLPTPLLGDETVGIAEGRTALLLRADGTVEKLHGTYRASALPRAAAPRWFTAPLATLGGSAGLTRGMEPIRIFSPRGATALAKPVVAWAAEPGLTYDVELQDALQPQARPARVEGVVPPLAFGRLRQAPLVPGGIFVLRVAEKGRPATAASSRFMVLPPAGETVEAGTGPAAVIAAAFAALNDSPARTGDAWLLLQQLPEDWRGSELGRRLTEAAGAK